MNKLRFLVPALIASAVVAGNGNLGAMNSNSTDTSADTDTVIPADTIVPDTPDTIPPAPAEITGITLSPKTAMIFQRESATFNASITPADAPADNLKWSVVPGNTSEFIQITSNGTSATVYVPDEVEKGNYKIVAAAADSAVADTCMLIVEERATRITLNMRDINLFPGETIDNIQAYLYYKDGSYTSRGIKWTTSNSDVAVVPSPGMVTGVAPGWAELIVTGGGQSLTGSIHVFEELDTIYVTPEVLTMTYGETKQIKATLLPEAVATLRDELIPRARVITPNLPEASMLLGRTIDHSDQLEDAARELSKLSGSRVSVMLKAGHLSDDRLTDIFYNAETGKSLKLSSPRVDTVNTHGTGCTLSSAIASYLALGADLDTAATKAKDYIASAIAAGAKYDIGHGHGPVHHFWCAWK